MSCLRLFSALAIAGSALLASGCAPSSKGAAIRLTTSNFDEEVLKSDVPVLVDFWATWCGPCQVMDPVIQELAVEYKGKAKVGKIDVDESAELAERYQVSGIPRFILFKGGRPVASATGVVAKGRLADMLKGAP